jgi:hypothetical protein
MQEKASWTEMARFDPVAEVLIQQKLHALSGREIGVEEEWRADEHYGVSVKGRRFVFRDLASFYRFEEFVQTELAARSTPLHDRSAKAKED